MSDTEIRFLENSIQKFFRFHRTSDYEELLIFINEMIDFNDHIKNLSKDIENRIRDLLFKLKKENIINWDEEEDTISLINDNYIKNEVYSTHKTINYDINSIMICAITHPTKSLDLKEFDNFLLNSKYNEIFKIKKLGEIPNISIQYQWDFKEYRINLVIQSNTITIKNNPIYEENKSALKIYSNIKNVIHFNFFPPSYIIKNL